MKILILNGPNINMLGVREPKIYGKQTFSDLLTLLQNAATEYSIDIQQYQSNHEGDLVDKIQEAFGQFDGIVINPAAYTHTSIAILDALKAVGLPSIEVHLSDISKREEFRRISYAGMACFEHFVGLGFDGYKKALQCFSEN